MAQTTALIDSERRRLADAVEAMLDDLLPPPRGPESRLHEAMRQAVLVGQNRLRTFLAVQSGHLFGIDERTTLRIAAAIECVHAQALAHGGLPALSDRDGAMDGAEAAEPLHAAFDEGTAMLAGNALLTLSVSVLASPRTCPDPFIRCTLVSRLCDAAGHGGMIGGQMIERARGDGEADIGTLTRLQHMKTGALIAFSCETGPLIARASDDLCHAMNGYAHDLALAVQIMDDLSCGEGSSSPMVLSAHGRERPPSLGLGETAGRGSLVPVLGTDRARSQADLLARQAVRHLDVFDEKADPLRRMAEFVIHPI